MRQSMVTTQDMPEQQPLQEVRKDDNSGTDTGLSLCTMRQVIDRHVFNDQQRQSKWSEDLALAMLERRYHALAEYLSHGVGFNDKSKAAFCELIGYEAVFRKKDMDFLIANYCGISLAVMLAERTIKQAKKALKYADESLRQKFSNADTVIDWVHQLVESGYNTVISQGNKSFLVDREGKGYHLQRTLVREYAQRFIEVQEAVCARKALTNTQTVHH